MPLVTVVTPSYNQGRFIRQTIESVLAQDYPSIEYIVMDGGSTDETRSILEGYTGRVDWVSNPDRGQASAVNEGWQRGRGEILGWVNSDDAYLGGAVRAAVTYLRSHPDVSAVYGEAYHTDEAGEILARYPTAPFDFDRLKETCFICQPTVFVRRSAVERGGYLDEALQFCMDYDLWIRIGKIARFGRVEEYLATSRLYPGSKTLGRRREVYAEVLAMMYRHFGCVAPTWIYAYAKAAAGGDDAGTGWFERARFWGRVARLFLSTGAQYNRRAPLREVLRWRHLLRPGRRVLTKGRRGGVP
jgi:glycosyltransferase involved in cell wall biosynthesis